MTNNIFQGSFIWVSHLVLARPARKMREQRGTKSCSSFGLVFSGAPSRASLFSFKKLSPPFLQEPPRSPFPLPASARSVSAMRSQQRKEEKQWSLFKGAQPRFGRSRNENGHITSLSPKWVDRWLMWCCFLKNYSSTSLYFTDCLLTKTQYYHERAIIKLNIDIYNFLKLWSV